MSKLFDEEDGGVVERSIIRGGGGGIFSKLERRSIGSAWPAETTIDTAGGFFTDANFLMQGRLPDDGDDDSRSSMVRACRATNEHTRQ
jgi:hypothetical protein